MPSLLRRELFTVAGNSNERTLTLSSTSNDGHYLSLRPLVKPTTEAETAFPFEWAFFGTNEDIQSTIESPTKLTHVFDFGFDANVYLNTPNTHRGPVETHWIVWDSGCLQEAGFVFPFGSEKPGVEFMELWQPIDINRDEYVIVPEDKQKGRSVVLSVDCEKYHGMVIVVGKWVQGILADKRESTTLGLSFVRSVEESDGKYKTLIKYGKDFEKFPTAFNDLSVGSSVDVNGATWKVLEATY